MPRLSRICMDFDNTLTEQEVREYAENLIERGFNLWILTARLEKDLDEVYEMAKILGVNKEHVIFTDLQYKYTFLDEIDPIFMLDDDWIEVSLMKARVKKVDTIRYYFNPDWMEECEQALVGYMDKQGIALTESVQARKKKSKYSSDGK